LIVFMRDGELQGYYVESGIANAFHSEISEDVKGAVKLLRAISVPARIWYTTIRPGFQAFNTFFRDPMRSHWHTKGLSLWRTYINLFKSLKAAGSELVTGVTEEALEEMRQRGLLISWANTSGLDDHDTQTERIFAKYSDHKAWRKNIANPFKKWFSRYLLLSNIGEIANKRAGFIYLKANQKALGLSDSEIDRMVRHEIGSPSFITGGSMTPVTNNLFLFSNAIIQGWRTDIGALKNNPKLLPKFIAGAVLPKAIMLSLQTGALVALLKALGADDDDPFVQWAKAMEEMYKRISEYDMTNYFCLPCGLQEDGEVVALRLPQDEFTRVVGGLFYKVVSGDTAGIASLAKDAARYMGDQGPGLNPLISCAIDTYTYLTDENPYDSFRRRHALTDTEQEARSTASGRSRAHKVFSKWLWNNYGGSFIYRFPYSNPAESKSKLENFLELPFMGDLAGRFVKVTDYGMVEKAKKAIAKPRGKRSAEKLEIRDAVAKDIQNVDLSKKEKSLMTSEYADYYRDVLTVRGGEQVHRLVEMGKNSAEKKAIIDSLFDRSSKDPAVKAVLDKFAGEQLYVISNAKFITRNKGENSKDFKKRQLKRDREVADAISLLDGIDLTRKEAVSLLRAAAIKHGIKTQKTIAKRIRQVLLNMYPNSKP